MGEYQYYEFQNVDRRLTPVEIDILRRYSTRARITPTSFVNEYHWGDFKGDPDDWMEKYFDAFLYYANWGTYTIKFQLPVALLDPSVVRQYCDGELVEVRVASSKVIISFCLSDEDQEYEYDSDRVEMYSMIGLRNDLARGDFRVLYLGWLLRLQLNELADNELEPPVPPGIGELNQSLKNFVAFLHIDEDLIGASAVASPSLSTAESDNQDIHHWVQKLPLKEKDEVLVKLINDSENVEVRALIQRFMRERRSVIKSPRSSSRTVAQIRELAETHRQKRILSQAEEAAKDKAKKEKELALLREQHLDSIIGRENALWIKVESLLNTKQQQNYDRALKILIDLKDIDRRTKKGNFSQKLKHLRMTHARKSSFIGRLDYLGLR